MSKLAVWGGCNSIEDNESCGRLRSLRLSCLTKVKELPDTDRWFTGLQACGDFGEDVIQLKTMKAVDVYDRYGYHS